ncbi:SURF1 family protein [Salinibacterium sp. NG253]|uniref:SURF1 family cytochrome oxidase biogenesis protein n=1 Tax=Salinibacterium sp. NG253 TaxID=2792039 RepID=UPI0018CCAC3D|nr:SURF1 family protein [Salinibacterium sp. NG253]MBH0115471.1 SURF1 family protein [Salinibacterium sp. NG253]
MNRWRFAFSRRWFGYLALVIAFAIGCVFLSHWQFDRRAEAAAEVARVSDNWDAAPQDLESVMPELDEFDVDNKWKSVAVTGEYLTAEQLLVRGRPYGGQPGFEVLVPFKLDSGEIVAVDRGWVPSGNSQDEPDFVPAAPTGQVELVLRLKPSEPTVYNRSAPEGQIATIHLPTVAELVGEPTYVGAYGLLASESPAVADMPLAYPKPLLDEGAHLSYAFQWVAFGVLAFIGLAWAVRQEYRLVNEEDPAERERAKKRRDKAVKRGPTDAEIEDAILDS